MYHILLPLFKVENYLNKSVYLLITLGMLVSHLSVGQTLKGASVNCGLDMGAAVADGPLQSEAAYQNILKQEYSMLVPENAMKMDVLKATEAGAYNYAASDRLVSFAQQNGMKVRGHTILWHSQLPSWVINKSWTKATLLAFLKDYITNVVGHFKGKITEWDVANEFIDDANGNAFRNSIWYTTIGEAVLDSAFKWVNQADPSAKLFYNDNGAETMNSKSTAVYNLVSRLKGRGVPIHGVGLQMHKSFNEATVMTAPLITQLDQNIKRIGALGLQVSITELDLKLPMPSDADNSAKQASSYGNILRVALANPSIVKSFLTWGYTGKYSWISCSNSLYGDALPFDAAYAKKPAYNELLSVLQNNCTAGGNTPPTVSLTAPANNASFCSGTETVLSATAADADGTISKVEFYSGSTLIGTVSSPPYTYNWTNAGSATHSITAKATDNGNASTTSAVVSIAVNAAPPAPAVATPLSYCRNSAVTALSATGTSLKWYTDASNGTSTTAAPVPGTTTAGTTNYYVSQTISGCESTRANIAVTVNALPDAPTVTTPVLYCRNAIATPLSALGANLLWYEGSTAGIGSPTPQTPGTATVGTTNYFVSQTMNGCEGARALVAVTINDLPTATIMASGSTTFSQGGSVILNANTGIGLNYRWFNGTTQVGTNASFTATSAGNYTVEVTNASGCKAISVVTTVVISGNVLPTVSITSPVNNTNFTAPVNIAISATANDADGSIAKVEFFNGSTLLGTDVSSPYGFTWTNVAPGNYSITAVATDNVGAGTSSSVINVTVVNQNPTVVLTSPQNGSTYVAMTSVTINATASDLDGTIARVEFYNGNSLLGSDASSPYSFAWNNLAAGSYTITAKAIDNNGGVGISSGVSITVAGNQASVITIASPSDNANVPGSVTISVTATDSDGSITLVEYLDGTTVIGSSTTAPYSFIWNNPTDGTHSITVRVTDSNGGVTTSEPITITVGTQTDLLESKDIFRNVYPNPVKGLLNIETNIYLTNASIQFVNISGFEVTVPVVVTDTNANADVSLLEPGIYSLVIIKNDFISRKKIVVIP